MRDFRDAKAMAHTLRAGLAARGLKITISQSLELIAETFGVADWNTLAAAIRVETQAPRKSSPPPPPLADEIGAEPRLSTELQWTLDRALAHANRRNHQYATLEHLLLALIEDADASALMGECNADLGILERSLVKHLDNDLKRLVVDGGGVPKPTAAFQRVVQRAVLHARDLGRPLVTGANTLLAIFPEARSPAVRFLEEQGMSDESRAVLFARIIGAATLHEK